MKKITTILLCVLMICMLAVPALAAQNAAMSLSASKATVSRGDTVTVTVRASAVENCSSGGFMFRYDKNVFEYVSGSALSGVSGYTAGISTAGGNVAGYFMNGNETVQGNIFQITLRVKDDAALGSYTISGVPNMTAADGAVSCSAGKATVTVSCSHNYGSWVNADSTHHETTCTLCQTVLKEAHKWDGGTVIKEATCKEGGQTKFTCTTCSATKTENTNKNNNHSYGSWTKVNDTQHTHTCSVCFQEETANHSWDGGVVTKKATCKETGMKTYTCTGCGAAKTETVEKLATHTYDHGCDTDCNVCGAARTITHSYKTAWSKDKDGHWQACSVCGDKKDPAAHTPGAAATETTPQKCTVCGYVLKAALGHTHNYNTKWTTDQEGHWHGCSGCDEQGSYAAHDFENACDPDCSICGYTRETAHTFEENCRSNAGSHWYECSGCGEKKDVAAHEPGAAATETTPQTCTVCGYEIAPALGIGETEPTETGTAETAATVPADGVDDAGKRSDGFFLWVILAAAVVMIGGTAMVVVKKKKM